MGLIPCPNAIWLAVAPVDMRLGADGLSLHVHHASIVGLLNL